MFLGVSPNKMSADLFRVCGQYTRGKKKKPSKTPVEEKGEEKPNEKCTPTKMFNASFRSCLGAFLHPGS